MITISPARRSLGHLIIAAAALSAAAGAQELDGFRPKPQVVTFSPPPSRVTCKDGVAAVAQGEPFLPGTAFQFRPDSKAAPLPKSYMLKFSIDGGGRATSIEGPSNVLSEEGFEAGGFEDISDLEAALAAWRFVTSRPLTGCTLAVTGTRIAVEAAPPIMLLAMSRAASGFMFADGADLAKRALPADSNCYKGSPLRPRTQSFPDWDRLRLRSGTIAQALIAYDIDAAGVPINVRAAASSGKATVDEELLRSVRDSRFAPTARTGCVAAFWETADPPLLAPRAPMSSMHRPTGSTCPPDILKRLVFAHPQVFPPAFQRRNIEGWGLMSFDVSPWGEVGNVKVIDAQPAKAFGEAAMGLLREARVKDAKAGYVGCVALTAFSMEGQIGNGAIMIGGTPAQFGRRP